MASINVIILLLHNLCYMCLKMNIVLYVCIFNLYRQYYIISHSVPCVIHHYAFKLHPGYHELI